MKNKITQSVPLIITLTILGFRFFGFWRAELIYLFLFFFLPVAIVLVFVPKKVFKSWSIFAATMILVTVWIILITPAHQGGFNIISSTSREDWAYDLGVVFTGGTLFIVILKLIFFRLRRFYEREYDHIEVRRQLAEQSVLFATCIGLISCLFCLYLNFNFRELNNDVIFLFLLFLLVAAVSNLYAFFRSILILFRKLVKEHSGVGWKLFFSLCILAFNLAIVTVASVAPIPLDL